MRLRLLVVCVAAGSLALAGADLASAAVDFTDRAPGRLIVTAPAYRLSLSKADGGLVSLLDSSSGDVVVRGLRGGCLWRAATALDATCDGSFSYRWDAPASTLHLAYTGGGVDAAVDVVARDASFDLRATVTNHTGRPLVSLALPADVVGAVDAVRAGYSPTYLPGVEFSPGFFGHVGGNVLVYPSRWAFADYLALDVAGGRLALYAVDPPPAPISPARVGFHHDGSGACSDNAFCIRHDFQTWIRNGATWTSPAVRLVTGRTPEQTIGDYRRDNGVDRYPSLAEKLGPRLDVLERAPEVKADLEKGLPPFAGWGPGLARLPSPALVHPVASPAATT